MGEKLTLHIKPDLSDSSLTLYSTTTGSIDDKSLLPQKGRVNILFDKNALGCVDCLRLRSEVLHECGVDSDPATVLAQDGYELDFMSPYIRVRGQNYLEVSCPLMDENNLLPDARDVSPPCLKKEQITLDL